MSKVAPSGAIVRCAGFHYTLFLRNLASSGIYPTRRPSCSSCRRGGRVRSVTCHRSPRRQRRELRNGPARHFEVMRILLHPDAAIAHRLHRRQGGAGAGERIEHRPASEREHAAHQLPQERLGLQAGMRRQQPLLSPRRRRANDVPERPLRRRPPEAAGAPLPKVVLRAPFQRLSVDQPRFPHGTRHDAHLGKLLVRGLGPVSAAEGHDQPHHLAAPLEARFGKAIRHDVRKQRVGCDDDIGARRQLRQQGATQQMEKLPQFLQLVRRQRREARQRRAFASVETGRYAPDAALPVSQLGLLFRGIFMQAVRRVRNDCLDGIVILPFQPFEAVVAIQRGVSVCERRSNRGRKRRASNRQSHLHVAQAIDAPEFPHEHSRRVEPQIGPHGRCGDATYPFGDGLRQFLCRARTGTRPQRAHDGVTHLAGAIFRAFFLHRGITVDV